MKVQKGKRRKGRDKNNGQERDARKNFIAQDEDTKSLPQLPVHIKVRQTQEKSMMNNRVGKQEEC